jgi:hypothetical protein
MRGAPESLAGASNIDATTVRKSVAYRLGGDGKELRRHLDAEEARRLRVEDQLELGRAHHRKVGGFAAG